MKIECPHCYQHYEIGRSDMDRELVCINCEQPFRVRDALVLEQTASQRRRLTLLLPVGMGALIALLLVLNLWTWHRLHEFRSADPSGSPASGARQEAPASVASKEQLQSVIAPLYRTLKGMRAENERLAKKAAAQEKTAAELKSRLEKTEKQAASAAGAIRVASQEESLNTLAVKVEGLTAQINLLDEYHKQLLKGLTDLRTEIRVLNIGDRLLLLEKKADEVDVGPIIRRIDKLEALLNAMRTVN